MTTETSYRLILFVYVLLWTCQLVMSHLTHSLIILTDSYINLFRILDILLGIVHLRTQLQLGAHHNHKMLQTKEKRDESTSSIVGGQDCCASRLFNSKCTYDFKRLPLLGSFMNGLFLTALLLSAAIEGIQTCLHVDHSEGKTAQILENNPLIYPCALIGFALVGLLMQYCSLKAHEMREEEICSESLLDMRQITQQVTPDGFVSIPLELDASDLQQMPRSSEQKSSQENNGSFSLQNTASKPIKKCQIDLFTNSSRSGESNATSNKGINDNKSQLKRSSFQLADAGDDNKIQRISMRSLQELDSSFLDKQTDSTGQDLESKGAIRGKTSDRHDAYFWIRFLSSPMALICCGSIILFVDNLWFLEISDAALALFVVVTLFVGSFPPMKKAGRVLLQTAPNEVNLIKLEKQLESTSCHILAVKDLHVWSLTSRSNRIATFCLVLDGQFVDDESQVTKIINEAKFKCLEQNITRTTIEPIIIKPQQQQQQPTTKDDQTPTEEDKKHKDHDHNHEKSHKTMPSIDCISSNEHNKVAPDVLEHAKVMMVEQNNPTVAGDNIPPE